MGIFLKLNFFHTICFDFTIIYAHMIDVGILQRYNLKLYSTQRIIKQKH